MSDYKKLMDVDIEAIRKARREALNCATDAELMAEINRRGELVPTLPKVLDERDFSAIFKLVIDHVDAMSKPDYCDDNDTAHYIYEAAMEAVYGKDIWTWVRQVRK